MKEKWPAAGVSTPAPGLASYNVITNTLVDEKAFQNEVDRFGNLFGMDFAGYRGNQRIEAVQSKEPDYTDVFGNALQPSTAASDRH